MNYHLKIKPNRTNFKKTAVIIAIFLLLSLFGFLFSNFTRTASLSFAKPVWNVFFYAGKPFVVMANFFISKNDLILRNMSLQDELASIKLKEMDYDVLFKENQDLKEELGQRKDPSRVIARVLSKPPYSPYDTLVLNVGESDGVFVDSKAYLSSGVVLGLVTSVTSKTSIVSLFSSSGQKQQATLLRTGASFEVEGRGGANFQIEVPKDADILLGDILLYPNHSSSVLGNVYYIDENSQSSFKTVYLRIPGNVFSVQWVFVEKAN